MAGTRLYGRDRAGD